MYRCIRFIGSLSARQHSKEKDKIISLLLIVDRSVLLSLRKANTSREYGTKYISSKRKQLARNLLFRETTSLSKKFSDLERQ